MEHHKVRPSKREYAEYLTEPQWEHLRQLAISTGTICQRCDTNKATQVHHTNYRNIVDVRPQDLVALCAHCHKKMHVAIRSGIRNQKAVLENDEAWLTAQIGARRKKHIVDMDIWLRLNRASAHAQRRASGLMKQTQPDDFTRWIGAKATCRVINMLNSLSRMEQRYGSRKKRSKPKRRRCI